MATATRTQRRYDHRLRNLVRTTRDIHCAIQRGVPRSTARGWLTEPDAPVVTVDAVDMDATQLQREVLQLRRRIRKLTALLRVLLVVFKISCYSLNQVRLPEGNNKRSLLQAIERSRSVLPLRALTPCRSLIAMCRREHWRDSLKGSAKSSPRRAPGIGWCGSTGGDGLGNGSIRRHRRSGFALPDPMRSGTWTRH